MFPYTEPETPWTAFFSSRPNLKKAITSFNTRFYAFSQLASMKNFMNPQDGLIASLLKAYEAALDFLGISVHHDNITGTSRSTPI